MELLKHGKNEQGLCELEFRIEPDLVELGLKNTYLRNVDKFNVPGFRKGKIPRKVIEKMYGDDVFFEEAINALLPTEYQAAVAVANINPIDNPSFEMLSGNKDEGPVIKATVPVMPEIKMGQYKGLKAKKATGSIPDAAVDMRIDEMRQRNSRLIGKEGEAKEGDIAVIDFEGFVDDVPFEGGKGEQYSLLLGSGQFITGFEEQVAGHKPGDEFDVNVSFPEEYHAKELAGKPSVFKVKLHEVKQKELPELDDEFAKDVSEFDTLELLKDDLRKKEQEEFDAAATRAAENALMAQVAEGMDVTIPDVLVERQIDNMVQDIAYRLSQQGMQLDMYLKYTNSDMDKMRESMREEALRQVRLRLALDTIAKEEGLEATPDELQKEITDAAARFGITEDEITKAVSLAEIRKDILANKALDLVRSNAEYEEVPAEYNAEHGHFHFEGDGHHVDSHNH